MLTHLHISNYAIIREVDIHLDPKLNIITGETGAGKSIMMGALSLILGDRADTKVLMNAEEKCVVEGRFNITGYRLRPFFDASELDYDETCILRREISSAGKSRAFINDTPVNLQLLKELGTKLVDIVSQHQTLELNEAGFQLSIVDAVADNHDLLSAYRSAYELSRKADAKLKDLEDREKQSRLDEDYFRFQLNELTEAKLVENEQEQLEQNLDILSHAETIQHSCGHAYRSLDDDEGSILDSLRNVKSSLNEAAKHHSSLGDLIARMDSSMIELKDVAAELENIARHTHSDPGELMRIDARLQQLFGLQKKYHVTTTAELITIMGSLQQRVDALGSLEQEIEVARKEQQEARDKQAEAAKRLSDSRAKAIPAIQKKINELLARVEMPDAKISVQHTLHADQPNTEGIDHVSFLFAANKGSSMQPLNKVASGGELSRLMLCIKSLVSDKVHLPTIIFDEIDTGISGEAALKVSQVMKSHATKHQVIAITHLPQIAGKADAHFFVYKSSDKKTTNTKIRKLTDTERVEEIARMLHGENPSEKILEAARELIHRHTGVCTQHPDPATKQIDSDPFLSPFRQAVSKKWWFVANFLAQ